MCKKDSFGLWLVEWSLTYKVQYKSYKNIKICIDKHIPRQIKDIPLKELTAFDVQKALNTVKLSRTKLDVYCIYHGCLKKAYLLGLIDKDISLLIEKPIHKRKLGSSLSQKELIDFRSSISGRRLECIYMFYLYTGCRRSEALTLRWEDIDFKNDLIHIKGTKTETSDRYVPLFPELKILLENHPRKDDIVFHHSKDFLSRYFKRLCPRHKLHDLRHTFATRCLECGINIKVVQKWLGHSRLDTTASIYTHLQDDYVKSEALKFRL